MAPGFPTPASPSFPDSLLYDLLDVSLTGVNVLRPVYDPAGEIEDFALEYLNPAGQRMTGLAERPGGTLLTRFPHSISAGILNYYRRAYADGATGLHEVNYQADGLDNYFRLAARRSGELLVVSFTDTSDQDRSAVEQALRQARAETEIQRQRLYHILENFPAVVASYRGPEHVFDLVSHRFQRDFPTRPIKGLPVRQALPELEGQQYYEILDGVYQTGEPFYGTELETWVDLTDTGQLELQYYNVCFQATRDAQGRIDGILNFAYDVTDAVLARQQLEQLNQQLETRVQTRTHELEDQQRLLSQILAQVPAAITTLHGPEHRFTFANDRYQQMAGGRVQTGHTVAETLPEVVEQGFIELLDNVYRTGQTFEGKEVAIMLETPGQPPVQHYLDFTYQPMLDAHGQPQGILAFVVDTTAQVRARHQAQALQAELLATARRQAHEREAFYHVFEQTPAPVALLREPGHRFVYVNPAYQALFPVPLVGLEAAEAAPELFEQGFGPLLDRVFQTGETYFGVEVPFTPVAPPGERAQERYFNFTYQAYRENGQVAGISIFAFEVTEQVQARQERDAQQRQLGEVFAQAPVAIGVLRGPGYVFDVVNPHMVEQLGRDAAQLLGRPFFEALPELVSQGLRELLDGVRLTGVPFSAREQEIQLARHPAGEPGYYDFVYQPLLDAQRHVTGIVCVATDVSAQVRARRLVEQREESFRLMADHAPAMLWVTDPAGYCTYLNAQWYDYTGQTEAEALGLGWTNAVHPDDSAAAGTAFLDANDRRVPFNFLYRLRRRDGKYRWAIDRGLPRFGPDGAFAGIVGTVVDVHEQKLAELALQKLTKKLRKSRDQAEALNAELGTTNQQLLRTNADLDNFVYTASHDLRAPIANLEALVSALRLELPAPAPGSEVAFLLNLMQDSIQRFSHTLELLTDVTKLQHAYSEGPAAVALAPLIEDVRLDLAPLLAQVGGHLHVDVAAAPTLTFSEKNLRSVVYNLVSNAFKYHDPARPADVTVRTRAQAPYVVLEVQDNGLGLDLESEHQLFGLFRRYHTHVEGSGVGLHMVKKLVENAGGKVEVTSKLGQGSTFTVYFPH